MKREDLEAALKKVAPAVSSKDHIPVLSCVCFDGKTVTAFDDIVAMQTPCDFEITGAIRGRLLIPWISASKATEIVASQKENDLTIKAGRSELTATLLPTSDFLFKFPDDTNAQTIPLNEDVITGIQRAMLSLGVDTKHPWRLGITAHFEKESITLYSSDDKTVSKVTLSVTPDPKMVGRQTILPPKFCELLVSSATKDDAKELVLSEDWVEARYNSGLRLFSRTVDGADVEQFQNIFNSVDSTNSVSVEIPKGIERCLERATVLIPFCKNPFTSLKVSENQLHFKTDTNSGAGVATDRIALEGHPDVSLSVTPDLMQRALPFAKELAIIPDLCVLYLDKDAQFVHLVSPVVE